MLAVAVKFLKDNQITCDIETETNAQSLAEALAQRAKQGRGRLGPPKLAAVDK